MSSRLHSRRGSTLIEVMVASVILLLGMTGVVAMMIKGMSASREASVRRQAQALSSSTASQMETMPYASFTAGSYDGGVVTDPDGRKYPSTVIVTQFGDGGVGAVRVEVHTQWTNFLRQPVDAVAATIISEIPDAG
jgi:type II secretory pathway pseudopilin PulG